MFIAYKVNVYLIYLANPKMFKVGQHRCGGIPRFVHKHKKDPVQWQSVLGSHLPLNFWLKEEQPVTHYLSGVS